MNEPNKREPYVCPKCGAVDFDCTDYEWDSDCLRQRYSCNECETQWDEYFALEWTGYAYKGVDYDQKGEVMPL